MVFITIWVLVPMLHRARALPEEPLQKIQVVTHTRYLVEQMIHKQAQ